MPAIQSRNLSHKIDEKVIFQDLSFSLDFNEIIEIRGPNGSGKSTVLKYISGLYLSKNITFDARAENNVAYLGHKNAFVEEISLRQNFKLNDIDTRSVFLKLFKLHHLKNQKYFSLSYGEKRKAALVNLFESRKKIWIIDEPFSGLDAVSIETIEKIIKKHANDGGLVIIANHQDKIDGSKKINLGGSNDS